MVTDVRAIYPKTRSGGSLVTYPMVFREDKTGFSDEDLKGMLKRRPAYGPAALYIHIPFCESTCTFCCFRRMVETPQTIADYVSALLQEIDLYAATDYLSGVEFGSIYFGGGTPSLLEADVLAKLITRLKERCRMCADVEITVECSTHTITREKLDAVRAAGANRLSFGVQTFNDTIRRMVNLQDTAAEAQEALYMAHEAGYDNVDIDLMYHLPGQSLQDWRADLETAIGLNLESISFYTLGVYPQSPLARQLQLGEVPPQAEDSVNTEMYLAAQEILSQAGYQQRHISRFALSGKNHVYTKLRVAPNDCVCFGLWANGSIGPYIYKNETQLEDYIKAVEHGHLPVSYIYRMDQDEEMRRFFVRGLSVMSVDLDEFCRLYGIAATDIFGDIMRSLASRGLLEYDDHIAKLSPAGTVWGHNVCQEFCSPAYLEESEKLRGISRPA